ncbi:MAG TPA: amidohydrolase family protein [Acidimicrobiales bacterium]|nr:amidohydrolase family protein [Acidimicrobiales bacterium]
MHDLVIKDAVIVDGTGAAPRAGDVAVDNGQVTEVTEAGQAGAGHQEIDADGRHLLPGWVDIHTHYDGQVTWDPEVSPSSWHGITTVVMGNCGVGFAPVRKGSEGFLIELMEGVEDIPGTALHEGIDWQWESFPEYLDALEAMPRVLDIAAQIPHAALRAYVMGDRAHDDATTEEVEEMADLVEEALRAGAIGFTTSRTILHNSKHGLVPGTAAPAEELRSIGRAMARAGHGVFEMVTDHASTPTEREWMIELAGHTGVKVTYALAQGPGDPRAYRFSLEDAERLSAEGIDVVPQVSCRPTGMLFGLQSSLHPFITHPTYQSLAHLPLAERAAQLRRPEVREKLVNEEPAANSPIARFLMSRWAQIFPLGDPPEYEPEPSSSVAAVAARENRDPRQVVLDWLLEREGQAFLFAPLASYADGDFEAIREMITHPSTVLGLSDGGAHCGLICDASMPTYLLTHWVRDRTRGPKLALETAVHLQTGRTASVYGLDDRGVIAPGKRADFNLVDLEGMRLHAPRMAFDLPAGGRRLVQDVDGYDITIVAGQVTFEKGQPTGARPGRLVRAAG